MEAHICERCGGALEKKGDFYVCPYCRAKFEDDAEERASVTLRGLLDEEKLEKLSNARRVLWDLSHRKNASNKKMLAAIHEVLMLYPDDVIARFYEASLDSDPAIINSFLLNSQVEKSIAEEFARWMLVSMEPRNVTAVKTFVERHFDGEEKIDLWTKIENEASKLDEGLYETSLPRDIFLAYSSADQDRVVEMVDFLESEGFTVFVAYRNLRHGKGAAERYEAGLYDAINHCKTVVFLSSNHSRSLACDALKVELPFIVQNRPTMGRVEFIIEEYPDKVSTAVKTLMKNAFQGLEWCRDREDLVGRILKYTTATAHVCPNCGHVNLPEARFCIRCAAPLDETAAEQIRRREEEERRRQEEEERQRQAREADERRRQEEEARRQAAAQQRVCPECQTSNPIAARFCINCGHNMDEPAAKPKPTPVPPKPPTPSRGASSGTRRATPSGDGMEISGTTLVKYTGSAEEVTIPDSVTEIAAEAFADNDSIKKIIIGPQIKKIGKEAFRECHATLLFDMTNETYTTISKGWGHEWKFKFHGIMDWSGADRKPSQSAPAPSRSSTRSASTSGMEISGSKLIKYTGSAEEVTIPSNVTEIAAEAFADNDSVKKIIIGPQIKKIGKEAFRECHATLLFDMTNETYTTISKGWGHEWKFKFHGIMDWSGSDSGSASSSAPASSSSSDEGMEVSGSKLVKYTGSAKTLTIPGYITEIGEHAFEDNESLEELQIGMNVKKIGEEAFSHCRFKIRFLMTKSTFDSISSSWGNGWKFRYHGIMDWSTSDQPVPGGTATNSAPRRSTPRTSTSSTSGAPAAGKVRVFHNGRFQDMTPTPASEFTIENGVLKSYDGRSSEIVIPANVTEIGEGAFRFSSSIRRILIGENVKKIGASAFRGSSSIEEVNIPTEVEIIDEFTFNNCASLKSIVIPTSVTEIRDWAFRGCSSLRDVTMSKNVKKIGNWAFSGLKSAKSLEIPSAIKEMGECVFSGTPCDINVGIPFSDFMRLSKSFDSDWNDGYDGDFHYAS